MITTKASDEVTEDITLEMSDIDTLTVQEMCENYFKEILNITPEKRQIDMLLEALSDAENEKEGELL